jgi:hypothetical protein
MLPILSTRMMQRAWPSRSLAASRHTPPFGVAPISANAIRLAHNRSPLTSRLRAGIAPTPSRYPSIPRNLINAALPACIWQHQRD